MVKIVANKLRSIFNKIQQVFQFVRHVSIRLEYHLRQLQRVFRIINKLLYNGMTVKSKSIPLLFLINITKIFQNRFKSLWDP